MSKSRKKPSIKSVLHPLELSVFQIKVVELMPEGIRIGVNYIATETGSPVTEVRNALNGLKEKKIVHGPRNDKYTLLALDEIILSKMIGEKNITKKLTKIKVASFSGCHMLRPSKLLKFDDPEKPHIFDKLIEATGAKTIDYKDKLKCQMIIQQLP